MFAAIIITLIVVAGLLYAATTEGNGLIARHSYNNRYNDASGAREDHLE